MVVRLQNPDSLEKAIALDREEENLIYLNSHNTSQKIKRMKRHLVEANCKEEITREGSNLNKYRNNNIQWTSTYYYREDDNYPTENPYNPSECHDDFNIQYFHENFPYDNPYNYDLNTNFENMKLIPKMIN